MRAAGNFNSEWGYLAPVPSFMRTVRVVLVATAIGATAGAAVVLSLIDRPTVEHDRTASIAATAHAIVTSAQATPAPAIPPAHSTTAALAAPVGVTTTVPAPVAATAQAQPPASIAPQVKPPGAPPPAAPQVAMQPPPVAMPPTVAAPQVTPAVQPQAAIQPQPSSAPPQAAVAIDLSVSENSAASGGSAASAPKPASGFASLSGAPSATEAAPAETTDQALVPPQTVPVKKIKSHAAYASNGKFQPTPGLGTVLRRLFSPPHNGTSY